MSSTRKQVLLCSLSGRETSCSEHKKPVSKIVVCFNRSSLISYEYCMLSWYYNNNVRLRDSTCIAKLNSIRGT